MHECLNIAVLMYVPQDKQESGKRQGRSQLILNRNKKIGNWSERNQPMKRNIKE